ncbi:unknown [[Mannheimia] succiniciproducens MBEL55E]|uniref:Uncharacterized protein n=1 Tax=Mannheimia succiniciproducens (strain KCTC 0769BP / MBEL55E) TaxID=221988 RepID=Q65TJ5_MANSM|nr:unknown [[Mannheimia] succiniciproducens MBEL55E]
MKGKLITFNVFYESKFLTEEGGYTNDNEIFKVLLERA